MASSRRLFRRRSDVCRRCTGHRTRSLARPVVGVLATAGAVIVCGVGTGRDAVGGPAPVAGAATTLPATVYVVNAAAGTVTGYPTSAAGDASPSVAVTSSSSALTSPYADAFDAAGDLWVANCGGHSVVEYTAAQLATGGKQLPAVVVGSATGALACPEGLAFDASGDLWVSSATPATRATDLVELSPSQLAASGNPTPASTILPTAGSLAGPSGLAFDAAGDLWVANRTGDDLVAFTPAELRDGGAVPPTATVGSVATSLDGPTALAFEAAGNLWVANASGHDLVELTPPQLGSGSPVPHTTLHAPGTELTDPASVAFDGSGDLWVTVRQPTPAELELTASELDAAGSLTLAPAVRIGSRTASIDAPRGAAFDATGDLWIVDSPTFLGGLVTELAAGDLTSSATVPPATVLTPQGAASLTGPDMAAFDASGDLWVTDYESDQVVELTAADLGHHDAPIQARTIRAVGTSLDGPTGLAFDRSGDLWVANETTDSVVEFAPSALERGGAVAPEVTLTSTSTSLGGPTGLAFDAAGDLWVADQTADSVVEFAPSALERGGAVAPEVTLTSTSTSLRGPTGLAFDRSGDLWVANETTDSVVEYPPSALERGGAVAPEVTLTGTDGVLAGATGIAFDGSGDLWVAAAGTSSLVEYASGSLAGSGSVQPAPADVVAGAATGLSGPSGVVLSAPPASATTPTVSGLSPSRGPTTGGTDVVVEGAGFTPEPTVDFGTTPATWVTYVSPTQLFATAPPGTGRVHVRVATWAGTSPATGANWFTYVPGAAPADGYRQVAADGGVFSFGAPFHGSMGGRHLDAPVVGTAVDAATGGYWEVAADGGVFSFDAPFYGSKGGEPLDAPVVGMAATPTGGGYWEVTADGGVLSFGDASYFGSMEGEPLAAPIVGMAATPDGQGYWLVAADGGVLSFGDARFAGSMGGRHLDAPVVGTAVDAATGGYWEVAADGGVFSFDAPFYGSMGGKPLAAPIVGMAATPTGGGYWLVAADGGVLSFGDAAFCGSMEGKPLDEPVVGMAAST